MSTPPVFHCPNCHFDLNHTEDTAGKEVQCPGCEALVLLPLLGKGKKVSGVRLEPRHNQSKTHVEQLRLNLDILGEGSTELREKSEIPPGKEKSPEEEQRRLAAMAGKIGYEHEKFEKKGKLTFACPLCQRPLWVSKKEQGSQVSCGGCGADILSPAPKLGLPVRVVDPTEPQYEAHEARKAVIPEARAKSGNAPARSEPILAKPELPPTGATVVLPSERISQARTIGGRRDHTPPATPAPEPQPIAPPLQAVPKAAEANRPRGAVRLNEKRRDFKPVKEIEADVEVTEEWGGTENKLPLSRRYLILAWIAAVPIFLGLAVWGMREIFRKKEPPAKTIAKDSEEDQVVNLRMAQEVLGKFYAAETVEAKAEYVRHPEITLPRMKEYYGNNIVKYHFQTFTGVREGRLRQFDFITGTMSLKNENPRLVSLQILPQSSKVLIDWESLVYWSEVPWEKFMGQQMERPHEFRVTMVRDDYYNGPYADETRWICWKLYHPASVGEEYGYCYGYTDASSDVTTEMIQPMRVAAERGQKNLKAILSLRFHPDARGKQGAPQVHIEKFTSGWLVP